MKRILIISLFLILTLCGCNTNTNTNNNEASNISTNYYDDYFIKVGETYGNYIVYARDTKVMYTISNTAYNSGNITVLVSWDGYPLLYKGDEK